MTKIERIEKYLYDLFSKNIYEDLQTFFITTTHQKVFGIYRLENGTELLDYLNNIYHIVTEEFYSRHLIPNKFATAEKLIDALKNFKNFLEEKSCLLNENDVNENTDYIILHLIYYKNVIIDAINYIFKIYDLEDENILLYQQLRYYLITEEIEQFIKTLHSILSSLSYDIKKKSEGYYHSNIYLILKLLGFEITTEDQTNIGRIDAVIKFTDRIYILEFKFSEESDDSEIALEQIIEKDYADKYRTDNKKIIGIGISFTEKERNILNYSFSEL